MPRLTRAVGALTFQVLYKALATEIFHWLCLWPQIGMRCFLLWFSGDVACFRLVHHGLKSVLYALKTTRTLTSCQFHPGLEPVAPTILELVIVSQGALFPQASCPSFSEVLDLNLQVRVYKKEAAPTHILLQVPESRKCSTIRLPNHNLKLHLLATAPRTGARGLPTGPLQHPHLKCQ